jgi:hypothetical protein
MSKTKTTQQQQQSGSNTVNWGYQTPPTTPAVEKLASTQFPVDPGLKYQYADLKRRFLGSFNNPMGAAYNPSVKDQMLRSGMERIGRDEAQAYRQGQYDVNKLNYGRDVTVAGMTQPQLVQTGGTYNGNMSGTSTTGQNGWGTALQIGGMAAGAAPMSL